MLRVVNAVEKTFVSYLSQGESSFLKTPVLPSNVLQTMLCMNGRVDVAAGQAGRVLHTMAVLQAYQSDLLKDLDEGRGLPPESVEVLCRTTDLALRATKQTAAAIGHAMAAMERYLWINQVVIGMKENDFLLDALLPPAGLFGTSIEVAVDKFREAKAQSATWRKSIPRCSQSSSKGDGLSKVEAHRQDQKSIISNYVPSPSRSWQWKAIANRGKKNHREVLHKRRGDHQHSVAGNS